MAIFKDKRELAIQARRKQFTGKRNLLGKIGNKMKYIPGLDIIGNEMEIAGSTGDLKEQLKSEGRKEALANTVNTAGTVASFVTPGGPLAKIAMGMGVGQAESAIRGSGGGETPNSGGVSTGVNMTTNPDGSPKSRKQMRMERRDNRKLSKAGLLEDGSSALVNETMRKGGDAMAMADLDKDVGDIDTDSLLMPEVDTSSLSDTLTDADNLMLEEMGTEAFENVDAIPSATEGLTAGVDAANAGKKGFLGIGKGGKLGAGINKFQTGKFAKGVGQAANVASIATSVGGLVNQQFASQKKLADSRKRARTEKMNNEYFSFA